MGKSVLVYIVLLASLLLWWCFSGIAFFCLFGSGQQGDVLEKNYGAISTSLFGILLFTAYCFNRKIELAISAGAVLILAILIFLNVWE
jgi:hypothetical protein